MDACVDFKFSEIEKAYDIFSRASETKSLKVNIEFEEGRSGGKL